MKTRIEAAYDATNRRWGYKVVSSDRIINGMWMGFTAEEAEENRREFNARRESLGLETI